MKITLTVAEVLSVATQTKNLTSFDFDARIEVINKLVENPTKIITEQQPILEFVIQVFKSWKTRHEEKTKKELKESILQNEESLTKASVETLNYVYMKWTIKSQEEVVKHIKELQKLYHLEDEYVFEF